MKAKFIGITGLARSGKDSIGAYLQTAHGFERYAFAGPIKAGIRVMFGLDGRHTDGLLKEIPTARLKGKSPRQVMQTLGTEWGRQHVAPTIWTDLGLEKWRGMRDEGRSLVITDVRFENEAHEIRRGGGVVLHVVRPNAANVAAHSSEAGVEFKQGDFAVCNSGTLAELFQQVEGVLEHV